MRKPYSHNATSVHSAVRCTYVSSFPTHIQCDLNAHSLHANYCPCVQYDLRIYSVTSHASPCPVSLQKVGNAKSIQSSYNLMPHAHTTYGVNSRRSQIRKSNLGCSYHIQVRWEGGGWGGVTGGLESEGGASGSGTHFKLVLQVVFSPQEGFVANGQSTDPATDALLQSIIGSSWPSHCL